MDAQKKFPQLLDDQFDVLVERVTPLILQKLQNFRSEPMVINMLRKFENGKNNQVAI